MIRFYKVPKDSVENKGKMRIDYFGYPYYLGDCDLRSVNWIKEYQEVKNRMKKMEKINSLILRTKGHKRIPLNFLSEEEMKFLEEIIAETQNLVSGVDILSKDFNKPELFYKAVKRAEENNRFEKNY